MGDLVLFTFWWFFGLMNEFWLKLIDFKLIYYFFVSFFFNSGTFIWIEWFMLPYYNELTSKWIDFSENIYVPIVYILLGSLLLNIIFYYIWVLIRQKHNKKLYNKNTSLINYYLIYFRFVPFFWFLWNTLAWLRYDLQAKEVIIKNVIWIILKTIFFIANYVCLQYLVSRFENEVDLIYVGSLAWIPLLFIFIVSMYYFLKSKKQKNI